MGRDRDQYLERATEDAEGIEPLEPRDQDRLLAREREEAEGIDVFENPDATLPVESLTEGAPDHEILTADGVGLDRDSERGEPSRT